MCIRDSLSSVLATVMVLARLCTALGRQPASLLGRHRGTIWLAATAAIVGLTAAGLLQGERVYRLSPEYREAAAWMRSHGGADASLAATEIGYLGYFTDLRVVDLHGLIHPAVQGRMERRDYSWWQALEPRFVVVHEPPWFAEPDLEAAEGRPQRSYRLAHRVLPQGIEGGLAVYERAAERASR